MVMGFNELYTIGVSVQKHLHINSRHVYKPHMQLNIIDHLLIGLLVLDAGLFSVHPK